MIIRDQLVPANLIPSKVQKRDNSVLDKEDYLTVIQDSSLEDEIIVVRNVETDPEDLSESYITDEQELLLKDAGPVFKGRPGPPGPDLYNTWLNQGNIGSFDDFLTVLAFKLSGEISSTYIFTQEIAASTWIINHNLNRYPVPVFEDTAGEIFEPDFKYLDKNTIEVTIISPNAGKAYLN